MAAISMVASSDGALVIFVESLSMSCRRQSLQMSSHSLAGPLPSSPTDGLEPSTFDQIVTDELRLYESRFIP